MLNVDLKHYHIIIIFFISILSFFLVSSAAKQKSLTWDEPTYIVSGYSYLDRSEIKLNPESPPLLQVLIVLPLKFLTLQSPDYSHPHYTPNRQVAFAYIFLDQNKMNFYEISYWSRLPIWLLLVSLVILVGLFVTNIASKFSGIIASILVATSPNLVAHAQLATTDFGCSLFMFASVVTLYKSIQANDIKFWALCGFITGLALLSKFTALLLAPIFLIIIFYEIIFKKCSAYLILKGLFYFSSTLLLIIFIGYGFKPWYFFDGLSQIYTRALEYQPYLFGKIKEEPVWYYYIAAFFVKTPVSTLLLLVLAIYVAIKSKTKNKIIVYLLVPVGVVLLVCSFDSTNIGLRRILPVFPFLISFISFTYVFLKNEKSIRILFHLLIAWNVVTFIMVYPNYISFFNLAAGGVRNGPNLLEDSNIDWGQDLKSLVKWQKNNLPNEDINLKYFGSVNPDLYGLKYRRIDDNELITPNKGTYAISVHYLIYTRKLAYWNKRNLDWLLRFKPIAYAGNSIYIYQFQ